MIRRIRFDPDGSRTARSLPPPYLVLILGISLAGTPALLWADPLSSSTLQASESIEFSIPSQPLGTALTEFAHQSNLQLLYPSEMTEGKHSSGVSGMFSPEAALQKLLVGTGLSYQVTDARTITIIRSNTSAFLPAAKQESNPQTTTVQPDSDNSVQADAKPVKVPEIVVKEIRERDDTTTYVAEDASTATRTDTPIRDVPQSIQVVTRKVIEEQRAFRLAESLENISGVVTNRSSQNLNDAFLIRGFEVSQSLYRNGLIDPSNLFNGTDSYYIQRLEVLKGPASVLYGLGDPGGIINIVTKKPLPDPYYSANATFGSYNFYRTELDATGPLTASKNLLYRINFAGQKAESFVDYVKRDLIAVSPAFTWLMGPRTTLTVEADYLKRHAPGYNGVPAQGTILPNINGAIPRHRNTSLGPHEKYKRSSYRVGYDFTHQFNNDWSVRNAYRYSVFEEQELVFAGPSSLLPDQRTLTRFGFESDSRFRKHFHNMFTNLTGRFQLLGMDHRLLVGVELRQDRSTRSDGTIKTTPDLDLFAPDYSQGLGAATGTFGSESDTKMVGGYLQDMIALLPNLKLLGGVRFDYVHQRANSQPFDQPDQTSDDSAVSPRVGLVYQPIDPVSLYASWTRGFLPNTPDTVNPDGELFKPERSTQYEVGIKTFFLDNRISTTLAWYHLTRQNLLTPDPNNPLFQVQTGEQRSQGIELDVTANLLPGWSIIASYAYTDAEVTKDNDPSIERQRLAFVPYNKASLWSTYFLQDGPLRGLGFGGGLFGYTSRNASIFGPPLNIPGYVRVDAALYYKRDLPAGNWLHAKRVNVALNIRNLLDQAYIESGFNSTTTLFYGESRTILGTVGIQF